jgi:hypothetical protein
MHGKPPCTRGRCKDAASDRKGRPFAYAIGRMFTPRLQFDDVEKRWRRLEILLRERRCSFRCSFVDPFMLAVHRSKLLDAHHSPDVAIRLFACNALEPRLLTEQYVADAPATYSSESPAPAMKLIQHSFAHTQWRTNLWRGFIADEISSGKTCNGSLRPLPVTHRWHRPDILLHQPGFDLHQPGSGSHRPGSESHRPGSESHRPEAYFQASIAFL